MQAKEERVRLRKASKDEVKLIKDFAVSLGLSVSKIVRNPLVLEVPGGKYLDVFDATIEVEQALITLDYTAYSIGDYIGVIDHFALKFKPGLPLAMRLSRLCGSIIRCIVISGEGERFFTYGKPVHEANIVKWLRGLRVVVNEYGDCLGWGVGVERYDRERKRKIRLVEPLIDIGWYLRRGG